MCVSWSAKIKKNCLVKKGLDLDDPCEKRVFFPSARKASGTRGKKMD